MVKTIYARNKEEVFFGSDQGFNKLNLTTGIVEKYYHNPFNQYSIINNQIWNIIADNNGNLWLATSNGISRLNLSPELFSYFSVFHGDKQDPVGTRVADVLYDQDQTSWIATSNGLLSSKGQNGNQRNFSMVLDNAPLSIQNINAISIDKTQADLDWQCGWNKHLGPGKGEDIYSPG